MENKYKVVTEQFEGPLDLLLFLVKQNNINIYDIPIAEITSQYLSYIERMEFFDVEVATEFLIMAATLLQIKSKMLLPKEELPEEQEEDPRKELVERLLEYKKFKEVGAFLKEKEIQRQEVFFREVFPEFKDQDFSLDVSLYDLVTAFHKVYFKAKPEVKEIIEQEISVEDRIAEIISFLEGKKFVSFSSLFLKDMSKSYLIVTFIALLELVFLKKIILKQNRLFGQIRVYLKTKKNC